MILTPPLKYPFEKTVTDLFDLSGHTSIDYADRISGYLEVERLPSSAFIHLEKIFLGYFSNYGVPKEISDDGYLPACQWCRIQMFLSSVAYPKSN